MARRAFVVGSETEGLSGADDDARRVARALQGGYGFEVDLCVGPAATRAGIAAGYQRLIAASKADDAALFYYSGHGAFAEAVDPAAGPPELAQVQCVVPVDFGESTARDFRGITAQELALWLHRLTSRTKNATVVLDCCHAAGMSRGNLVMKSLRRPFKVDYATLRPHVELVLSEHRAEVRRFDVRGNPHAVRLVATGQRYVAWEYTDDASGESRGVLTEGLLVALGEAMGHRVTWQALGDRVREYVLAKSFGQRPEVEGPSRRLLFETAEAEADGSLVVVRNGQPGRCVLRGGRVHGVHEGDEYRVVARGGPGLGPEVGFGTAKVVRVEAAESTAALLLDAGRAGLPEVARALPLRSAAPKRSVRLEAPEGEREAVAYVIEADPLLRLSERDEPNDPPLARVRVAGDHIELLDLEGRPATLPLPYGAPGGYGDARRRSLEELVTNLRRMAAAERLRTLASQPTEGLPEGSIEVRWGRVERGRMVALDPAGEQLKVGDFICLWVRNKRPDRRPVHVSVIDIGLAKKTTLLTIASPSGHELPYGHEYVFGRGPDGSLRGAQLSWPEGLPEDGPRPESLVVLASDGPVNLAAVERPGLTGTRSAGGARLEQLVQQAKRGTMRDLGGSRGKVEGYLVHHIEFYLAP